MYQNRATWRPFRLNAKLERFESKENSLSSMVRASLQVDSSCIFILACVYHPLLDQVDIWEKVILKAHLPLYKPLLVLTADIWPKRGCYTR